MQQSPDPTEHSQGADAVPPDVTTMSTTPMYMSARERQGWPQMPATRRSSALGQAWLPFCLNGLGLVVCCWLIFPLFLEVHAWNATGQALLAAFPWLNWLCWTRLTPLVTLLGHVPWLNVQTNANVATATLLTLGMGVGFLCLFLVVQVCRRAMEARLRRGHARLLLALGCVFLLIGGGLFALMPGSLTQNVQLTALYGRLTLLYHSNPYVAAPTLLASDPLYRLLPAHAYMPPQMGPLWLDLTLPLVWLTRGEPALTIVGLRLLGLLTHLGNALLLWSLLSTLKPETRLTGTLLYAWNPVILWLGISEFQAYLVVIFLLLLGALFLQRRALLVSWFCLLLSALISPLCLLLLPLFLRVLIRETRAFSGRGRVWWGISVLIGSLLLPALVYAPYWSGWGIAGIGSQVSQAFWQTTAQRSLLATFSQLPFANWPPAAWLLLPEHWLLLPGVIVSLLLLLGLWIGDNLELALLFGSWIFLVLAMLLPQSSPWLSLLALALSVASSSRRTSMLAHLLTLGVVVDCVLLFLNNQWSGQALLTIGVPVLLWGWTLFFISTWEMTHQDEPEDEPTPRRLSISLSRPSWPSRPAAWPARRRTV
jgi:hypothetical protein